MILYKPGTRCTVDGRPGEIYAVQINGVENITYLVRPNGVGYMQACWIRESRIDVAPDTPCWETEEITFKKKET